MTLDLATALASLREDSLLALLPPEVASTFVGMASLGRAAAGELVCHQGQEADRIIIPIDGRLQLKRRTPEGTEQAAGVLTERRALNLGAVLQRSTWEYSATAERALHFLQLPAEPTVALLAAHPSFFNYLLLMTTYPGVREAAHTLRKQGLQQDALRELITSLDARHARTGDLLADGVDEPRWLLVDSCRCRVELLRGNESVADLECGEYFGAAAISGAQLRARVRCLAPGTAFTLESSRLRALFAQHPGLRDVLVREHPDVARRVRPGLLAAGVEFTSVVTVPRIATMPSGGTPITVGTDDLSARAVTLRRFEGVRCDDAPESAAAAAASVCQHLGIPTSFAGLRRQLRRRQPATLLDVATVLEQAGLVTHASTLADARQLGRLDLPVITTLGQSFTLIHEVRGDRIVLFDPMLGLQEWRREAFEDQWSGQLIEIRSERPFYRGVGDEEARGRAGTFAPGKGDARRRYLGLFGSSGRLLWGAGLLAVAAFAVGLIGPRLSQVVLDRALVHGDLHLIEVIALGMVLLHLSTLCFEGAKGYIVASVARVFDFRLATLFYRHALGVSLDTHKSERVGTTLSRFGELERIRDGLTGELLDLTLKLITSGVYVVWLFTYDWRLGAVPLLVGPIAFFIARVGGVRFRRLYDRAFKAASVHQSRTAEQLEGIATLKAIGATSAARNIWEKSFVEGQEIRRRLLHTNVGIAIAMQVLREAAQVGALYLGVSLAFSGELSPGAVLAVSQYLSRALDPLLGLAAYLDQLHQLSMSFQKLDELFTVPLESGSGAERGTDGELRGQIRVRDLSFRYGDDAPWALRKLNFDIEPGQVIAVVGRSGSGKTTLAKLIHGLHRPTEGGIAYDGQSSAELSLAAIRRQVGVVLQDSQLMAGSIADNIAYGDDRPDPVRVRDAARLAAAHEFIAALPRGYDTFLAEGGLGLSGGQRQRISIARALYRDPKILVFDEATSSLDAESEAAILANMRSILRGRTAILVAHRLHTVKSADQIIVLERGELVERGTHDQLAQARGLYHRIIGQQWLPTT